MDYLTYESFIHPDVLKAFLIKDEDVIVTVKGDYPISAEIITVDSVTNVFAGDKFVHDGVVYQVRTVDTVQGQIFTIPLKTVLNDGTKLTITKEDRRAALQNFYDVGARDYAVFAKTLAAYEVPVRFDSDVYILKVAFIAMYKWILHNKAFLRDINLTGVGIPKSQVFDHFYKLLQQETDEWEMLRKEAMDELKQKQQNDADGKSGTGFVSYSVPSRGYFSGYRRW